MVQLDAATLAPFPRFAVYNSPYAAHRDGRAVDLYPGTEHAPSPVAGTVRETRTTSAPSRPSAAEHDHLIVIDTGSELARVLHVEPAVEAGDVIERGDSLGRLVRSGYFAPWVDNHVHLGFRAYGTDPVRASGSLPIELGVSVEGVGWDGTGTVLESGDTYAALDAPAHPAPGEHYVGIADDAGTVVLDGGLPHYETGGAHPVGAGDGTDQVSLLGTALSQASGITGGREPVTLDWADVTVRANGTEIVGLSFLLERDRSGAKLICPDVDFAVGETVQVAIEPVS